jgi:plastocyanin
MRFRIVLGCAVVLALACPNPATAAVAVTVPGSFVAGFATPAVVASQGEAITYANADIAPHNFIALDVFLAKKAAKKTQWCSAYDKGKCPIFWSDTIGAGATTDVRGVENLEAGATYTFFCSVHPNMKGTLIIR